MNDGETKAPPEAASGEPRTTDKARADARRAALLRANLRRRKDQARARAGGADPSSDRADDEA
ncbi:MAG: hypothetical protein FJX67_11440 [Alphaproteobacteria bacterium]|nr:hypothetical protein [Alphaproteobacteria bacterium]